MSVLDEKQPADPAEVREGAAAGEAALDEATRRCLRLFQEDPAGLPAFRSVEVRLKKTGAWEALLDVYQQRTEAIVNRAERALIFGRMGHIFESRLSRPEDAARAYRQALNEHAGDTDARHRLERILEASGCWEEVATLLEEIAPRMNNAADRLSVQIRHAEVLEEQLGRTEAAVAVYEHALETDPQRGETFQALYALLERLGRHARLAELLEAEAGHSPEGPELLERAAALYANDLAGEPGVIERAIACHERIFTLSPPDDLAARSRVALIGLYRQGERWESLVEALQAAATEGGAGSDAALRERAELLEQQLRDPVRALEAWRSILDHHVGDSAALAAAERLARAAGESSALAHILGLRERAGFFETDAEAIAICDERSRILENLGGRDEEAAAALEAVLARDPIQAPALERLCDLYDRMGRPHDRARKLLRLAGALPSGTPDAERGEAWREAGQALEAVGQESTAIDAYRSARQLLPDDLFVLARLQAIHEARGEIAEEREAAATELSLLCEETLENPGRDPEREMILLERVALDATALSRADEALACWEALLSRDPAHRGALRALAALYEKLGDDEGLLAVVMKASQIEEAPATRLVLLVRAGKLYETACDDPEEAVAAYERALVIDSTTPPALEGLQRLYPALGRWEALAELLGRRAEIAADDEKAEILIERAHVLESRLSDLAGATVSLEEALVLAPACPDTLRALGDLYRKLERWEALDGLLAREADLSGEGARRGEIAGARAALWEGPLDNADRAVSLWEEALAASPGNDMARERLRDHYERAGRWAEVARLVEDELACSPEPRRALALHLSLGEILEERLGQGARALTHYRAVAVARPGDPAVQQQLHRALAKSEAWDELVGLLREEADRQREVAPYTWGDALVEIAHIQETALDEAAGAESTLREVIAAVPEHTEAQARLFRRLEARGDLEGLSGLIESSLAVAEEPEQRIALAREAFRVALASEGAEAAGHARTIDVCKQIVDLGAESDDVLAVMGTRLEAAGRYNELLDALSRRLSLAEGTEAQMDVTLQLATLWEERFHRPDQALILYRQARQIDPASLPSLRAMARLCEDERRWEELLGVLETLAREESGQHLRAAATYRAAVILHTKFGRDHDAMGELERALELDPSNEDARDLLERLAVTHHRHRTLARILRERIEVLPVPEEGGRRAADCERLGDLLADHLKESAEAADAYRQALAASEGVASRCRVALKLEALWTRLGDRRSLADLYPDLLKDVGEPSDPMGCREAAGIWARYGDYLSAEPDSGGHNAAAAEAYGRACDLDPEGALRFKERRHLLERMGAHDALGAHLENRAARIRSGVEAVDLRAAAGAAWEATDRIDLAEQAYRRALDDGAGAPGGHAAHAALARILNLQGRKEDLAALCERRILLATSLDEERSLRLQAAGALRELPGRSARALAHYRRALDLGAPEAELLRAIADLSLLKGDGAGAVEALEIYLELPPPRDELTFVLSTLARLWEESLGRTGRAAEYCKMWIEADPGSGDAKDRLERLLEARSEWRSLTDLIETRVSGRGAGVTARLRVLARLCETRLKDPHRALGAWMRILAIEPDTPDALNAVAESAPALGRWRDGAAAIERLIAGTPDPARRVRLRQRQADLLAPHPAERPRAIEHLYALLDEGATPEQGANARPALLELLEREGRFEEARRLLEEMIEIAAEDEKPSLYAALGELAEARLWRFDEAVAAYQAWLSREPAAVECMHRLQSLYRRLARWHDLAAMLRCERETPVDDERLLSLSLDLAVIEEEHLGALAAAAAEYERALALVPDHLGALRKQQDLYRALEDHEALHRSLGRELSLDPSQAREGEICLERARLEAGPVGRPEDAIQSYERAVVPGTDAAPVLDELAALHARLGRLEDHLNALGRLAEITSDANARSEVLARMAGACEQAGDPARAIAFLEDAVSINPGMAAGLASLRRLYEGEGDFEGAAASLERLLNGMPVGRGAAALAADLGVICQDKLHDLERAEACYERAIALDSGCNEALARFGEIKHQRGDHESACAHLSRALALDGDGRGRRRTAGLALMLGLSHSQLGESDAAVRALTKAVRLAPALTDAWQALGGLYLQAGEWASARDAHTRVANAQGIASDERTAALHGIARAEQALGRPETGLVAAEGALGAEPDRYDLRLLRAELMTSLGRGVEAATAWREAAMAAPSDELRAEALYHGAEILDAIDGQKPRAYGWLREALSAHPDHTDSLRRLADHALASSSWREAGAYLESLAGLREDARDQSDLGRVWWEGFGEEQNALGCLRRSIELPGDGLAAVELAVAICEARENWPRLAGFIEAYFERVEPCEAHLPLLSRLADVYADRLYEPEGAARSLRALMALEPGNAKLKERLAEILSGSADTYGEAAVVYRSLIEQEPLRASAWRGLGGIYWFQRRTGGCRDVAAIHRLLGGETSPVWESPASEAPAERDFLPWRDRFQQRGPFREALDAPLDLAPLIEALQGGWSLLLPDAPAGAGPAALGERAQTLGEVLRQWGLLELPVLALPSPGEPLVVLGGERIAIGAREEEISRLAGSVWRYLCHRVAARIALEQGPAGCGAPSLRVALAALRKAAGLDRGPQGMKRETGAGVAGTAVTWKNRRRVRKVLAELESLDDEALACLAAAHARTADRAALIAGRDPGGALFGVASREQGLSEIDPDRDSISAALAASRAARGLLAFISEEIYLDTVEAAP
ncbi:MAG: tetratricopeptide repeat protein [Deltaproteobacteria bacterium]|nr:tetratricopeptide repeat protein [Deltaproteobacteria bacterium]